MKFPLLVLALAVESFAADALEVSDDTLRAYAKLDKMTATPRSVAAQFAGLCFLSPAAMEAMKRTGPHYGHFINVFMNETARKHFEARNGSAYPVGSIVVKEKLLTIPYLKQDAPQMNGVAGLIKRAPGFDAKAADWEFFFIDRDGKLARGAGTQTASCADCHRDAKADFVFGDFATPTAAR